MIRRLIGVSLLAALAALALQSPAAAASRILCAPEPSAASGGPRQAVNNSVTPNVTYNLNSAGCAVIAQSDVGFFLSQGYTAGPLFQSVLFTTGVMTGTTSVQGPNLPAGSYLRDIIVDNTTANAVTGGISFGSTTGAADIATPIVCAANCLVVATDALTLKRVFSKTAQTPIWITAVTGGNNANLTITFVYGVF